ncbi:MAG: hypothetical protein PHH83_04260 [Patescibacteria group bacterium]|nr:hypothetical protein [Patescibacteria group bacterium]
MKFKIVIILLSIFFALIQSSFDFGILNINLPLIFFIYILFFHNPNDSLIVAFISAVIMDFFAINFGAYIFSFLLIFIILYYIEKELLPNDRFSTYIWMNMVGIFLLFVFFLLYNLFINSLNLGIYNINFEKYIVMFFEAIFFNIIISSFFYYLANTLSNKTKNRFISIG